MPIIADPQKLSMPEQVQRNKNDIKEIYKKIDGLDSLDNVVEVPNMSHILTAQELEAIEQPVAFIIYNNNVYLKRKIESGIAYFDRVFFISGSTVIAFDSEEIQATLSNGALAMISNSVSTYSKSEIDSKFSTITYVDSQVALCAKLAGANFSGPITASAITEIMGPGYAFDVGTASEMSYDFAYAGVSKTGNKITFVIAGKIKRLSSVYTITLGGFTIPSAIGQKLYPTNGTILEYKNAYCAKDQSTGVNLPFNVYKTSDSYLTFRLDNANNLDLNTDYFVRCEITFLLSDNLLS